MRKFFLCESCLEKTGYTKSKRRAKIICSLCGVIDTCFVFEELPIVEPLLTAKEVGEILKMSAADVLQMAKNGVLKTAWMTPGGQRRFTNSGVAELLKKYGI